MCNALVMTAALFVVTPTAVFPVGLELAWNACYGQPGAVGGIVSNCDSNTGSQSLFASFRPPPGVDRLEGVEVFVDFRVEGAVLPCWWIFSPGRLRTPELVPLHVSPTDANGVPLVSHAITTTSLMPAPRAEAA